MKSVFILISLCVCGILLGQTQEMYQKEMNKIVMCLDSANSIEQITDISNRLVRVNKLFPNEWQPFYYEAYADLNKYFMKPDLGIDILNGAEDKIERALKIENANKSELWALQGYVMMMKINTDPMNLGAALTGATYKVLEKSIKENPENPRPRLVLLSFTVGKKAFFKDDISLECEQLPKIENLINSEPKLPLTPSWDNTLLKRIKNSCTR